MPKLSSESILNIPKTFRIVINFIPWTELLHAKKSVREAFVMPNLLTGKVENIVPISNDEIQAFKNAVTRCHKIFKVSPFSLTQ